LTGGDGDDTLTGGADGDRLTGGPGADRFVFASAAETRGDVITDFTVGEDRIDLSAVGDFVFSVEGPRARSLWTARDENGLHLRGDTDGDAKTAEVDLTLSGVESLKSFDLGLMPVWGNALDVSTSATGVTADMRRHADIASMTGGRGDDVFTGTSGKNALFGQDGNDTLDGHDGDDSLYGGAGADRLTGGAGRDRFVYTTAAETRGDVITDFVSGEDRIDLSAVGEFAFSEGGPRARSLWLRRGEDGSLRLLGDTDGNADTAEVDLHLGVVESLTTDDLGITTRIAGDMIDAGLATDSVELHVTDWTGVRKARGGAGADVLTGNDRNNHLYGQGGDDRLYGRDMDDHLDGGDGDDRLYGEGGDDTLEGEAGNDTLEGGDGNDNLKGGSGDDLLQGEKGNDVLEGGTGHDTLEGGAGSDALDGGDGDDVLRGGEGADTLTGGAGSDRFVYNTVSETTGDRITDFTSGEDRLDMSALGSFAFSKEGPQARSLWVQTQGNGQLVLGDTDGNAATAEIRLVLDSASTVTAADLGLPDPAREKAWTALKEQNKTIVEDGTVYSGETRRGDAEANTLSGTPGPDTLHGEGGDDIISGGSGDDILNGGAGHDWIWGDAGNDTLHGGAGWDLLEGGAGADTLTGGEGRDIFAYDTAKDTVGDVITDFTPGSDTLDLSQIGGLAFSEDGRRAYAVWTQRDEHGNLQVLGDIDGQAETEEISLTLNGLSDLEARDVNLGLQIKNGSLGSKKDSLEPVVIALDPTTTVINADGSNFDDRLSGDDRDNILRGMGGDDVLEGRGGWDTLYGHTGNDTLRGEGGQDTLHGGDGNDRLYGGDDNDTLNGDGGNDVLNGGEGEDILDGGDGVDTADYADRSGPVSVILRDGRDSKALVSGRAEDTLRNIENVTGGSAGDHLTGNKGANVLKGGDGDDRLLGKGGDDILDGGYGKDVIDGGDGIDTVDYSWCPGSLEITLAGAKTATVLVDGEEEDTLRNIENIIGGFGDDTLTGDDKANTLTGGEGADTLAGGGGADRFVYTADSFGDDVIVDFDAAAGDRIDLAMKTATGTGLSWNPDGPQAWSVWMEKGNDGVVLYADLDGNADTEDLSITLRGVTDLEQSALII
ncbi:hypothetical protein HEQ60_10185, partial [Haematospirillum sp. H1815]|uniref:M10 family metallopeptidase C-terminal domain-containing protein n=1 Tax=Haematospirillum sp. H1815 TaxID=2723108 RepID=UPI0016BC8468